MPMSRDLSPMPDVDVVTATIEPDVPALPGSRTPRQLADLVADWLLTVRSPHTQAAYRRDIALWLAWCGGVDVDPIHAGRADVDAWIAAMETSSTQRPGPKPTGQAVAATGRPPSPATVKRRTMAVSSWFSYLVEEGVVVRTPVARRARRRVSAPVDPDRSTTVGLNLTEALAWLDALVDEDPRMRFAGMLMVHAGVRVGEVVAADWEHLGYDSGHCTLTVVRKGGRRQALALAPDVCDVLDQLRAHVGESGQAGPLVVNSAGQRATRYDLRRMVRRVAKRAGITSWQALSPHSLRHAYATLCREAGVDLYVLQDDMGHADPRTTRRYDRARHRLANAGAYRLASYLAEQRAHRA